MFSQRKQAALTAKNTFLTIISEAQSTGALLRGRPDMLDVLRKTIGVRFYRELGFLPEYIEEEDGSGI